MPRNIKEALSRSDAHLYEAAIQAEINSLEANKVFETVHNTSLPPGTRPINCLVTFKKKASTPEQPEGMIKMRIVANGARQVHNHNFNQERISSPVARTTTFRAMMAQAAYTGAKLHKIDIVAAFLNGTLEEPVYVYPPPGLDVPAGTVWKLLKALYGLRQAPLIWYQTLDKALTKMGFKRHDHDKCLYTNPDTNLAFHVDDFLLSAMDDNQMQFFKDELSKYFKLVDFGEVKEFVGMQVERLQPHVIKLHQTNYINQQLEELGMQDCRPVHTPLPENLRLVPRGEQDTHQHLNPHEHEHYRKIVGILNYLAVKTRPDFANQVRQVAQHVDKPDQSHLKAAKHILRYLKGSASVGITYARQPQECEILKDIEGYDPHTLQAFSDASHAPSVHDQCRSISGYVVMLHGGAIAWRSHMQETVSTSATQSELIASSETAQEIVSDRYLLNTLAPDTVKNPTVMWEDNQGARFIATNIVNCSERLKHVHVRYHFVRECITNGDIEMRYIPTGLQLADSFTKNLGRTQFARMRSAFMGTTT